MAFAERGSNRYFGIFTALQLSTAFTVIIRMKSQPIGMDRGLLGFTTALCFYLAVLTIPVFLYIKYVDKNLPLNFLKLDTNMLSGIIKGFLIGGFVFIIIALKNGFKIGTGIHFREDMFIILGRILVGLLEEIPFRGFYMQKLQQFMEFYKANILSSVLFTLIHVPGRAYGGFSSLFIIFIVGLWMGYIFKETKSLWCAAVAHSIYNLSLYIFQ